MRVNAPAFDGFSLQWHDSAAKDQARGGRRSSSGAVFVYLFGLTGCTKAVMMSWNVGCVFGMSRTYIGKWAGAFEMLLSVSLSDAGL